MENPIAFWKLEVNQQGCPLAPLVYVFVADAMGY